MSLFVSLRTRFRLRHRAEERPLGDTERVALIVQHLTALLRGGVEPGRVWQFLARERDEPGLREIAENSGSGQPVAEALARQNTPEWRAIAVAWSLAEQSGAPLAPALQRMSEALLEISEIAAERDAAMAAPQATLNLVVTLPPLTLGLAWLLGMNPLPFFVTAPGALVLALGTALFVSGWRWIRRMILAAEAEDRVAGLACELTWIVLGGGCAPAQAVTRVIRRVDEVGVEWVAWDEFLEAGALRTTLRAAEQSGVPVRPLLLERASLERARLRGRLLRDTQRLGVRVLIPMGCCILPAFFLIGVVPTVAAMFTGIGE